MKSRRGLSPVITSIFLMAMIITGIGISLGIIFPNLEDLNDQLDLETNSSNLIIIDANFREMMLNGFTSKLLYTLDLGSTSFLFGDISSTTSIQMRYREVNPQGQTNFDSRIPDTLESPNWINETYSRLIIRQKLTNDILSENTNQYLIGSGVQNKFYINPTDRASIGWTILNQSRFDDSFVYTVLSYRNIISISKIISNQNLDVNATIVIQRVKFDFIGNLETSINFASIEAEYKGTNVTTYNWAPSIPNGGANDRTFYIQTTTDLDYGDASLTDLSSTDIPYSIEVPGLGTLNVRIQFIDHIIEIRM
ncbi:MAG: hypothetical protein GPJ54_22315 [Candidatus Heimdallarchaeota archaeon]|nr:hypothetical protein [Candidatus Heimdallarchaeota archaeon]